MKTNLQYYRSMRGYVLTVTLIFVALGVVLVTTIMNWTSETSRLSDRQNEYYSTAAAAEAATEKVLVHISRDYIAGGNGLVNNNLANYKTLVPTAAEYPNWGNYTFYNPQTGAAGGVYVTNSQAAQYTVMTGTYSGLNGYQAVYRIIGNALLNNSRNGNLRAGVEQSIGTEAIPLFQFAIFYNQDLEMNPSPPMVVTGRVHSNGSIYTLPSSSLTFSNDVTAAGSINLTNKPGDPLGNRGITTPDVIFDGEHSGGQTSLNLPIGTNSTSTNVEQILQMPPAGESVNSAMGSQRMYNKADLLILVSNSGVTVQSGPFLGNSPVTVPQSQWTNFLATTNVIWDARQNTNVQTTQLNVSNFDSWVSATNNPLTKLLEAADQTAVNVVYIADMRTGAYEPGVYLKNGAQLPPTGLTVATPDPVYIQGDYNTTTDGTSAHSSLSVNSTTYTYPSAVMGDAVTILSDAWQNSKSHLGMQGASDTTVNTALLVGIVPTGDYNGSPQYSGGVENFPRFLENWSGKNFWYNGSMVAMFDSQIAKVPWNYYGSYYNPPNRHWAFDVNFENPSKLPPATPMISILQRMTWAFQAPGVVPP
jgi:hypothetical protein